jgi:acyl-coenzyme A synthetase/AMP-(fatty) acid ligase
MTTPAKSRTSADARFTKIETSLDNLAGALTSFVNESREHRSFQNAERDKMWTAIQQADRSRAITWPMIFTAITVFLAVMGTAAKVSHTFTEMRAAQIEQAVTHAREIDAIQYGETRRRFDRLESR